jgi:hypothetical protein
MVVVVGVRISLLLLEKKIFLYIFSINHKPSLGHWFESGDSWCKDKLMHPFDTLSFGISKTFIAKYDDQTVGKMFST